MNIDKQKILLQLPNFLVWVILIFCLVGLRVKGVSNVFPFSQWEMFSVPRAEEPRIFLEAQDLHGKVVCKGVQCSILFAADKFSDVYFWTNGLVNQQDALQKEKFRTLILANIISSEELKIFVLTAMSDPKDFIHVPKEEGKVIDEFQYRSR